MTEGNGKLVVLGLLQNAWSPAYAGEVWPRESWIRALHACTTGRRLAKIREWCLNEECEFEWWYDNANPLCGPSPESRLEPDSDHVARLLNKLDPYACVAFGQCADEVLTPLCREANCPLISVPHPMSRTVTDELFQKLAELLYSAPLGKIRLRQNKPGVVPRVQVIEEVKEWRPVKLTDEQMARIMKEVHGIDWTEE